MSRNRLVAAVVAIVAVGVVVWFYTTRTAEAVAIDLTASFESAEKRSLMDLAQAFQVRTMDINGDVRSGIFMHPPSRLTYKLTVPERAWLKTAIGIAPQMWTQDGVDGVIFAIGVGSEGYHELMNRHLDPAHSSSDRTWAPILIDLSAYAGKEIELVFNTRTSPPGADNGTGDWAFWAEPAIIVRD
jgi:hypothetical protein